MTKKATATAPVEGGLTITQLEATTLLIPIVGTSPLIVHNFSQKSKQAMLDAQTGKKRPREIRDPQAEYLASLYNIEGIDGPKYGFPVTGFKAATVGAARFYNTKAVNMTALRQFLFFKGVLTPGDPQMLVPIEGEHRMREDVVRIGQGSADLRYRAEFPEWSAVLKVTFVRNALTKDSVLSLVDAGGLGVGVGEWRPERRGDFGTYRVDTSKQIQIME